MIMFFDPFVVLGMILVLKVLGVMAIANHWLILDTFVRAIFGLVAIVILIWRVFVDDDFVGMIWIIAAVPRWQ